MKLLSRAEEIILVSILKLKNNAYGVSIRGQIHKDTGDNWSFASIYTPLDRLHRKKYVQKLKSDPLPERGGKSRFYYSLTPEGKKALLRIQDAHQKIWLGVPDLKLELDTQNG